MTHFFGKKTKNKKNKKHKASAWVIQTGYSKPKSHFYFFQEWQ